MPNGTKPSEIVKDQTVAGRYINEKNQNEYLDLDSSGAFHWRVGGRNVAGSYKISEEVLTLVFPPVGATARGKLVDGHFNCCLSNGLDPSASALVDDESKTWLKQGQIGQ